MKRNTKECDKCGREISLSNFSSHYNSCNGIIKEIISAQEEWLNLETGKYKCPECNKEYSKRGIGMHIWRTHGEGSNFTSNNDGFKNGIRKQWCEGLTKETDERLFKMAEILSFNKKGKPGHKHTEETKLKMSKSKIELYKLYPEKHPNAKLAGNKKKMTYPEQLCANWLDENNIEYIHNKCTSGYYPDFIIGNIIIEIDGEYWHQVDESKTERTIKLQELGYQIFRIKAKENIIERMNDIFYPSVG